MNIKKYNEIAEKNKPQKQVLKHTFNAFIVGGIIGIYDRLGNFAGAGSFIPITGFSNAMTSSALEARSEGLVTGIGANIFKLGGAVITFGIVASFIVGGLRYVITYFW